MASLWPIKELTDQYCRLDSHFKWTKKWGAIQKPQARFCRTICQLIIATHSFSAAEK